ncbi:right-handed parallel beta-helix repeat-containing protein [Pectobacterium betavasculorum]|uniref:Right handed beta helix domain-containing protein n=1 Tax=Pectobacterium betavasculorum TaxID=55207 RepID=A0ABR4V0S5_9GAMM|nr:right-handed parallel beta-helix repeat-containing protein [Pectobacterium betavasculorum]KFX20814.1 hypothetical protein JV35_06330 [Pectobacterium betavasculorum]
MLSRRVFLKYLAVSLGLKWSPGYGYEDADTTPEQFGAVGDGVSDDTRAIQLAIDSGCKNLRLSKKYAVFPVKHPGVPGIIGRDSICIKLRSDLRMYGDGEILLSKRSKGVSGAILSNASTEEIRNCVIEISVDGQNAGGPRGFSGIVFINAQNCSTTAKTNIANATYNGIQFARNSSRCTCNETTITNTGYIGIQAQNPIDIVIENCIIKNSSDNGIDFESNKGNQKGTIRGNVIEKCKAGIFLESGGNCLVEKNNISLFKTAGIYLNRINTPADNVKIIKNIINGSRDVQFGGVAINNAIKNITIEGNEISNLNYGVWTNGGISEMTMNENTFRDIYNSFVRVADGKNQLVRSTIKKQKYIGKLSNGRPSVINEIKSINDLYNVTIEK